MAQSVMATVKKTERGIVLEIPEKVMKLEYLKPNDKVSVTIRRTDSMWDMDSL